MYFILLRMNEVNTILTLINEPKNYYLINKMNQFNTTKAALWWHRIRTRGKSGSNSLSLKKRGKLPIDFLIILPEHATESDLAKRFLDAMKNAIKDAGINREDIGYINAHGTSTPAGDVVEAKAIKSMFGDHSKSIIVNSTKSMIGHLLGAAGGVEAIATIKSINNSYVTATINYKTKDPDCDLDYTPNNGVEKNINHAISNNFGFGGHNASIVISKFKD